MLNLIQKPSHLSRVAASQLPGYCFGFRSGNTWEIDPGARDV